MNKHAEGFLIKAENLLLVLRLIYPNIPADAEVIRVWSDPRFDEGIVVILESPAFREWVGEILMNVP